MKGLMNKKVLVTGGTSGIGQAIAVRFAVEGAHVAINYRKSETDAAETDALVHKALEQCVHDVAAQGLAWIMHPHACDAYIGNIQRLTSNFERQEAKLL